MSVVSQGLLTGLLEQRRNPVKIKMTTSQITKSEMYFRQEEMGGNSKEQRTKDLSKILSRVSFIEHRTGIFCKKKKRVRRVNF